jgi:hypothetical protein
MNREQITANFKAAHKQAILNVTDAQHAVMEAQAKLAAARKAAQNLEKKYREEYANATEDTQLEMPLDGGKKK